MQPLGNDIERAFRKKGLLDQAVASWILSQANEVGKGRFKADTFRDGTLTCLAGSLPVAELQLMTLEFRNAINKHLGREVVQAIRFKSR